MNNECDFYDYEGEFDFCSQCGFNLVLKKSHHYIKSFERKFCSNNCNTSYKKHDICCGYCGSKLLIEYSLIK